MAPRGERDADALGRRLVSADGSAGLRGLDGLPPPGVLLSSSATRAAQTAERVAARFLEPLSIQYLDSLYAATPQEVLRQVVQVDDAIPAVLVVGHNPSAQELAVDLVDRRDHAGRNKLERHPLVTCALAVYRVPATRWQDLTLRSATLLTLVAPPY